MFIVNFVSNNNNDISIYKSINKQMNKYINT